MPPYQYLPPVAQYPTTPIGHMGVASFLLPQAAKMKLVPSDIAGQSAAEVRGNDPTSIQIRNPSEVDAPILTHEVVHGFQLSRNPAVEFAAPGANPYDYSKAMNDPRASIANVGYEGQAKLVEDYQRQTQAAMAAKDPVALQNVNDKYQRLTQQLADLPGRNDPMTSIATAPRPIGPPPTAIDGKPVAGAVMAPSKLLGNTSIAPYPVAQASTPNMQYAKPGPYATQLAPQDEASFQQWVQANKVPWKDSPTADYDMRGYWKAQQAGDPNAKQAGNLHFPDTYKTPYHKTFSNESQYATPNAPRWYGDVLKDASGKVIADETPKKSKSSIKP